MGLEAYAEGLLSGSIAGPAALGVALLGGLVAGFGPCVLPMMPAVFGYVTGQVKAGDGSPDARSGTLRGLALAGTFVLGMTLLFTAIGVAAALAGRALLFGGWAYYPVAGFSLVLGLHLVGLVSLPFDQLNRYLPQRRPERRGFVGAFLFGLLFGVVASPCSTPILAAIAGLAAVSGSTVFGGLLLFVYGLAKGTPLLLIGLLSGALPQSELMAHSTNWGMKVGGLALLGTAAYLLVLAGGA